MRVAGRSAICRYTNEELVWVEPQNMPQAIVFTIARGSFYRRKKDESGSNTRERTRIQGF